MAAEYIWLLLLCLSVVERGWGKPMDVDTGVVVETRTKRDTVVRTEGRCGAHHERGSGAIELPTEDVNGTYFYRANMDCYWQIVAPIRHQVILRSPNFGLELSDGCEWDYVKIEEEGASPQVSRYCGWRPLQYIATANELTVIFHSDESYEDTGFTMTFEAIDETAIDASHCNSRIPSNEPGSLSNTGPACLYSLQAPDGQVVEVELTVIDFGSRSCEQESVTIYSGLSTHGEEIGEICSRTLPGAVYRAESMFIDYHSLGNVTDLRFHLDYRFVDDVFTPAPTPSTTPSPVGGQNDCSGRYRDLGGTVDLVYSPPQYENNKHCVIVVRNTLLANHVVQVTFPTFDLEQSDDCMFDSVKVISGERQDSEALGGLYCGTSLNGKTLLTTGNSLRLEFNTDESFALFGFEARISFVPTYVCECEKENEVCVRNDYEKLCIPGKTCDIGCKNGGTCVRSRGVDQCYCPKGFSGKDCSDGEGGQVEIRFKKAPTDKSLIRDSTDYIECSVDAGDNDVKYSWTLNNELISMYNKKTGFGSMPGGLLQIDKFTDQLEGRYSCFASTEFGTAEHTFELTLVENCLLRIFMGPQDDRKNVGEDVLFTCHVPRAATVIWKKDGFPIDFDKNERYQKLTNNYLRLSQLVMLDKGTYRCEAEDLAGCYSYREAELTVIDVKPHNNYCGISRYSEVDGEPRITKAYESRPGENPWHVTFRSNLGNKAVTFCGGTVISQSWVLTAAHCVTKFQANLGGDWNSANVHLYFGTTNCNGDGAIRRAPKKYIIHPDFERDGVLMDSDLALIEVDPPLEYSSDVRPICLQTDLYNRLQFFEESRRQNYMYGTVAGCGQTSRSRHGSSILRQVNLPYVDRDGCEEAIPIESDYRFTDAMICAGNIVSNTGDTCRGDSGGGLMMESNHQLIQTGIVSWGIGCDRKDQYGYYTNVGMFFDWIKAETRFDEEQVPNFWDD